MAANKQDIERWFLKGVANCATHLIVVCDTYDYDDYPVYVLAGEDVHKVEAEKRASPMQTVMEVYNLQMDMFTQLNERRSFNY